MNLVYFKDRRGNFGDDLNPHVWRALLPDRVTEADFTLVGIGSILNAKTFETIDRARPLVILGSGASYGPPPEIEPHWQLLALRGPLTARLLGREEAAITDGAILLAACPGLAPVSRPRSGVVFMPHAMSASPHWQVAAAQAGMDYVDPSWPVLDVLERIGRARLVVTEAMHGAIVADALRIPWVPVRLSPRFDTFKWLDWTLSMGVPLAPVDVPPASLRQWVRDRRQRGRFARALDGASAEIGPDEDRDALISHLVRRHAGQPYAQSLPVKPLGGVSPMAEGVKRLADRLDPLFVAYAARHLRRLAGMGGYMSDERLFVDRLERMLEAVARLPGMAVEPPREGQR